MGEGEKRSEKTQYKKKKTRLRARPAVLKPTRSDSNLDEGPLDLFSLPDTVGRERFRCDRFSLRKYGGFGRKGENVSVRLSRRQTASLEVTRGPPGEI